MLLIGTSLNELELKSSIQILNEDAMVERIERRPPNFPGFESQSSWVPALVLCLSRSCKFCPCTVLSVMIMKLKPSLGAWMPYTPLKSE